MQALQTRGDLGMIAMKGYSDSRKLQYYGSNTIRLFYITSRTSVGRCLTPLRSCGRCIRQPQPTGLINSLVIVYISVMNSILGTIFHLKNNLQRIYIYIYNYFLNVKPFLVFQLSLHFDLISSCIAHALKEISRWLLVYCNNIFIKRFCQCYFVSGLRF